jgi:hypothetical protein
VEITVGRNRTIQVKAPQQQGEYRFPANTKLSPEHPIGMLMTVAHKGEWKNPPKGSADYERISRSFRRLQQLLMALIPLPGKPFHLSQSASFPSSPPALKRVHKLNERNRPTLTHSRAEVVATDDDPGTYPKSKHRRLHA